MIRLCFVCLGNICRSPTAEGIMVQLVERAGLSQRFVIDSAGTAAYHVGERPDPRSLATAQRHGVALPSIARRFVAADFDDFDYVLAMDRSNQTDLLRLAALGGGREKVHLLRSFDAESARRGELDVPDPYYGDSDGFEAVFQICRAACTGLLQHLRASLP
jgi:protein-tyrosine phosphatase